MAEDTSLDDPEEFEEPNYFVRVTGFSTNTTQDALLNFFENTRRSGGGDIKDIQFNYDEGFADIIFCSNNDAEQVVKKKGLQLDDAILTTTLKPIPKQLPKDHKRLQVMGISDKTIRDGLVAYIEVMSGKEIESTLFGNNCNCVVSFVEPIDFHELQRICKTSSLDDSFLNMEQVIVCDTIEVSGFTENTTKDTIMYYFRNNRNGGGEVKSIEIFTEGRVLLSFEDPKVVDTLLKQVHVIDGVHLVISRYYPFLGETSLKNPKGEKRERVVQVDPQTIMFIEEFCHQEFDQLLKESQIKYTWQQGSGEIVLGCGERKMDKKRWDNSCDAVVSYVNQFVTDKISISQEIWEEMSDEVTEKCVGLETQIQILHLFDFSKKQDSIIFRGKKTDVCALSKELHDKVSRVEKQIMFEKSKVTKKIDLSEAQMELMCLCGFVEHLKSKYEDLEIVMDSGDHNIQMRGQEDVVNEGNVAVWQTLAELKETELKLDKSVIDILASEEGKAFLTTMMKMNKIDAMVCPDSKLTELNLVVTAVDRNNMKKAVSLIHDATSEESIPLDIDQKHLIDSEKWRALKDSIQQSMLLRITEKSAENKLLMVGYRQEIANAKERIEEFFKNHTNMKKIEGEAESAINDIGEKVTKEEDCVEATTVPRDSIELKDVEENDFQLYTQLYTKLTDRAEKHSVVNEDRHSPIYGKEEDIPPLQDIPHTYSDSDDEEISLETMVLDIEPKLMYILQRQVNDIEKKYKMKIDWKSESGKVHLSPNGKDAPLFDQGKEEFITLYQKEFQDLKEMDFTLDAAKDITDLETTTKALMKEFAVVIERKGEKDFHIFGKENHMTQVMQRLLGKFKTRKAYKEPSSGELPMSETHAQATMLPLSKKLENGVVVSVHQGDITKVQVDVIVNATNERLDLGRGAIIKQGGRQIQQESDALVRRFGRFSVGQVAHTGPGNLPYKHIYHAVGPQWRVHGEERSRQFIFEACIKSFNLASKHRISSIALPGISSGIYGVPKQICAEIMFAAAEMFSAEASSDNQLKDIRFVNIDTPTYEAFRREFHNRYGLMKGEEADLGSNSYQGNANHSSFEAEEEREYQRDTYQQRLVSTGKTDHLDTVEESERKKRAESAARRMEQVRGNATIYKKHLLLY